MFLILQQQITKMYCGCGTKSGKMRWISVVALIVLGIAFWIMYGVEVQKCDICDKGDGGEPINCQSISAGEPVEINDNEKVFENCSTGIIIAGWLLGLVAFICATIPCCIMCCCAKGPQSTQFNTAAPAHGVPTPYIAPQAQPGAPASPYMAPAGANYNDYNAPKPTV